MNDGSGADGPVATTDVGGDELTGRLYEPLGPEPAPAVLVLHGAGKGDYTHRYARLLAYHGYAALRLEYFDAPGVPEAFDSVPVEYFSRAIDWVTAREGVREGRVGVIGWSRGSEAATLLAAADDRVRVLVGYAPSAYSFPGLVPSGEVVPAWTRDGEPVAFVPPYDGIEDDEGEPSVVRFRRTVERADPDDLDRARLPVEDVAGPVVLVSGGDDRVWPSPAFAETLIDVLEASDHDWPFVHLSYEDAGHAIAAPYESTDEDTLAELGGTDAATAHAAADAWRHVLEYLALGLEPE